jgi:hypothetical protein
MTWTVSSKSQAQRRRERELRDRDDAIACAERAGHCCEVCGYWAPYPRGQLHHSSRKASMAIRHNRDLHIWLCVKDHREEHSTGAHTDAITRILADR